MILLMFKFSDFVVCSLPHLRRTDTLRVKNSGHLAWGCIPQNGLSPIRCWDWLGLVVSSREATPDPDQVLCRLCSLPFPCGVVTNPLDMCLPEVQNGIYWGAHGAYGGTSVPGGQPLGFFCWPVQCAFRRIVRRWATRTMPTS